MTAERLTIDVNARISVPDETIDRCLRLLEMWQEDNPDKHIEGKEILTDTGRKIVYQICVRGERKDDAEQV